MFSLCTKMPPETMQQQKPLKIGPNCPKREPDRLPVPSIFRCKLAVGFRKGNHWVFAGQWVCLFKSRGLKLKVRMELRKRNKYMLYHRLMDEQREGSGANGNFCFQSFFQYVPLIFAEKNLFNKKQTNLQWVSKGLNHLFDWYHDRQPVGFTFWFKLYCR